MYLFFLNVDLGECSYIVHHALMMLRLYHSCYAPKQFTQQNTLNSMPHHIHPLSSLLPTIQQSEYEIEKIIMCLLSRKSFIHSYLPSFFLLVAEFQLEMRKTGLRQKKKKATKDPGKEKSNLARRVCVVSTCRYQYRIQLVGYFGLSLVLLL